MKRMFFPLFTLGLPACLPAAVDLPLDGDADGLLSDAEVTAGTDPANPDSDDDGHLDGAEIAAGTDPLDREDHPYLGGWPMDGHCRNDVVPTGNDEGQIAEQFELPEQHGETLRLHDFCDKTILITSGAFW